MVDSDWILIKYVGERHRIMRKRIKMVTDRILIMAFIPIVVGMYVMGIGIILNHFESQVILEEIGGIFILIGGVIVLFLRDRGFAIAAINKDGQIVSRTILKIDPMSDKRKNIRTLISGYIRQLECEVDRIENPPVPTTEQQIEDELFKGL